MPLEKNKLIAKKYRPFIKWVGGKRGLLKQLLEKFPFDFKNYHEPFLGGGAVFFELYSQGLLEGKKVYLSDINSELINTYTVVKNNPDELIKQLEKLKKMHNKEFYYAIRAIDRTQNFESLPKFERAARFIYLNKTCFNGLYRVNSSGFFNTPMGSYVKPNIVDIEVILNASLALQNVSLASVSFTKVVDNANKNDLIYFDPPYYPLTKTSNFTSYDVNKFLDDKQFELFEVYKKLDNLACNVVQSNSNTDFIHDLYKDFQFLTILMATRTINSNIQKRKKIKELVIRNFE